MPLVTLMVASHRLLIPPPVDPQIQRFVDRRRACEPGSLPLAVHALEQVFLQPNSYHLRHTISIYMAAYDRQDPQPGRRARKARSSSCRRPGSTPQARPSSRATSTIDRLPSIIPSTPVVNIDVRPSASSAGVIGIGSSGLRTQDGS